MPEPEKTPQDLETERQTAAIAAGVSAAMKPVIEQLATRENSTPAPVVTQPQARIVPDVGTIDAEIDDAIANGRPVSKLLARRDEIARARLERDVIDPIRAQGGAAIGSMARQAAERLPRYKTYKKEIDQMVADYQAANPAAVVTYEIYDQAHSIVSGRHVDDILNSDREEQIRQGREREAAALLPTGGSSREELPGKDPTSLQEILAGDWKRDFRTKSRAVGNRTEEEELRKAGYKNGFPDFLKERRSMEALEDIEPSFGLDKDWMCAAHQNIGCARCSKANAEGEYLNA